MTTTTVESPQSSKQPSIAPSAAKRPAKRAKRRKPDHKPLKIMLTAGTFLATWLGTGLLAQQEAANAVATAQVAQPAPITVTYVEPDGSLTERTLDLDRKSVV